MSATEIVDGFSALTAEQLNLIKKTLPEFEKNGYKIAVELYAEVFRAHPELRSLFSLEFLAPKSAPPGACPFNLVHSLSEPLSPQARILSRTIVQLASSLEKLHHFDAMISRICNKHVSRNIRPEHYPVVVDAFKSAMKTVLGDQLSEDELEAWNTAVLELSRFFVKREEEIREKAKVKRGVRTSCSFGCSRPSWRTAVPAA
jgi:nitric oxide dioxygenase